MSVEFFRGYGGLESAPHDWASNSSAVDAWCRRRATSVSALERRGDYLQDGWGGWAAIYDLGLRYGWVPVGTQHDDPEWDGDYFSNDGARVVEDDAHALAFALERALRNRDAAARRSDELSACPEAESVASENEGSSARKPLGEGEEEADAIRRYVRFLKRGAYTIE